MSQGSGAHADDVVMVVNTINRRTQPMARDEVDVFLRKHKLFRLVEEELPPEPKKKIKKPLKKDIKIEKEDKSAFGRYATFHDSIMSDRKRKSPEGTTKSSPTPSEPDGARRRKGAKEPVVDILATRPSPLITMTLQEMHEVIRLYTSSPLGCVDWQMISETSTGGRIPPADVEYAANEFLPQVHYRPSVGLVVMERQSRIPTEYQKHRQTMKRLRQGLVPLISELRTRLTSTSLTVPTSYPERPQDAEPMLITPEVSPDELVDDQPAAVEESTSKPSSARRNTAPAPDISNYLSCLPVHVVDELRQRAVSAMNRLEQGQFPTFALRSAAVAQVDAEGGSLTATGRLRKRYETKAMRLAREAAAMTTTNTSSVSNTPVLSQVQSSRTVIVEQQPGYEPPPFYVQTARQFERSHDGDAN